MEKGHRASSRRTGTTHWPHVPTASGSTGGSFSNSQRPPPIPSNGLQSQAARTLVPNVCSDTILGQPKGLGPAGAARWASGKQHVQSACLALLDTAAPAVAEIQETGSLPGAEPIGEQLKEDKALPEAI